MFTAKTVPTFYFIGVSTARSSIMPVFPRWMQALGYNDVVIEGIDHPLHDDPAAYRRTVEFIKHDARSLGGLVTTHKIDLLHAARDYFDYLDESAQRLGEVSCISKRGALLAGHAKDPLTSRLSLEAVLGENYFARTGGHVLCFGAGGAGKAIALYLLQKSGDQPSKMIVTDIAAARLEALRALINQMPPRISFDLMLMPAGSSGDDLLAALPEGSVVINATGMGKDTPGSPISDQALFPRHGVVWELNYRGDLLFWHQAMAQAAKQHLTVEDGWVYFLHGWTQVIAEVLHLELTAEKFAQLAAIAADLRPPLTPKTAG
ncbi:MAG: shikimate dehydrogenase [Chloroflexi bacterium]|nr:shikimate dehydrogenase [Chloroflexota bacterium]